MNRWWETLLPGLALLPALAFGAHPVDELAHLTAAPEKAESLGFRLTECPIALGSFSKIDDAKVLAQGSFQRGMAEQMWEWRSYRVLGTNSMCVELVRPIHQLLTRERAAILSMVMNNVLSDGSVNREEVLPWEVPSQFDDMPVSEAWSKDQQAIKSSSEDPIVEASD